VRRIIAAGRIVASAGLVALITLLYSELIQVNPATVALSYVVAILILATAWGIVESTTAAIVALLGFNFFFLPPVGTLTIADPQNWVAFLAFLVTAIIASQLSGRARQRELDASARQRDLERLYALSRSLLLSERGGSMPGEIARQIADAFDLQSVGVYDRRTDRASWAGSREMPTADVMLREVARRAVSLHDASGLTVTAIHLGGAPIGSVGLTAVGLSDTVLNSIANLAAIGLERSRADEATARAKAARESSELRAAVLDALAHEFKTPLTAMKVASSDLRASGSTSARDRELVAIIDEELDHLGALVTDAVQMLRIDAGDFTIHPERHQLTAVVDATLKQFDHRLEGHNVVVHVPGDLAIDADGELLALALRQLLDNALKYSPPASTIEIRARGNGTIDVAVSNSGSIIPDSEQGRIFERFYRGSQARQVPGSGMGLAIVQQIARAHGGTLTLSSSSPAGTTFTLSLPRGVAAA
jgi:two-component system, OmpR family, sensor histidine kinase KdpD